MLKLSTNWITVGSGGQNFFDCSSGFRGQGDYLMKNKAIAQQVSQNKILISEA